MFLTTIDQSTYVILEKESLLLVLAGEMGWSSGMSDGRLTRKRALRDIELGCSLRLE